MEASVSASSSNNRLRSSRLRLLSSFAIALTAFVLVSGYVYKSLSASVEKETRELVVDTAKFRRSGVDLGFIVPHRTDRGDNMASEDQRFNWSHLVGTNAEEAKKKIKEQHPHLHVVVVPQDGMMTMDYQLGRVRIFKDAKENVARVPMRG